MSAGHVEHVASAPPSGPAPNLRGKFHLDLDGLIKIIAIGGALYAVADKLMDFGAARGDVATIKQIAEKQAKTDDAVTRQGYRIDMGLGEQAKATAALKETVGDLRNSVDKLNETVTQLRIKTGR